MGVPSVDKFLCCLKLELSVYLMVWFGLIATVVGFFVLAIVGTLTLLDFEPMKARLVDKAVEFDLGFGIEIVKFLLTSRLTVLILLVVMTLQTFIGIHMNVRMLKALKNKNAKSIRPMLWMLAIGGSLSGFMLFPITWLSVLQVTSITLVHVYLFICVHSVYVKFKNSGKISTSELNKV